MATTFLLSLRWVLVLSILSIFLTIATAKDTDSHGRGLEGEGPMTAFDSDDDHDNFTPARSLDYFRYEMDSDLFEWIRPEEIQAGGTTCGFLKAPLSYGRQPNGLAWPKIQVYFCVRFGEVQPAPKGNIFIHCGGPSSLSDCAVNNFVAQFHVGPDNLKYYNVI